MTTFTTLYNVRLTTSRYICVGLDPDLEQIPDCVPGKTPGQKVGVFLRDIIDATSNYAAAYKLQSAYYEDLGDEGPRTLQAVLKLIRQTAPDVPIILDYKRADIGRTNEPYARLAFDYYDVDAVTVHPYLGMEAMAPFLSRSDKTIIVLCRTSNPGAGEFQDVMCMPYCDKETGEYFSTEAIAELNGVPKQRISSVGHMPLYEFLAYRVAFSWNKNGNCAVVVGATYADVELAKVRDIVGNMPILIPGIGTQGGDLAASIQYGKSKEGWDIILNNSSAILFAYSKLKNEDGSLKYKPEQFAEAAAEATKSMHDAIVAVLSDEKE